MIGISPKIGNRGYRLDCPECLNNDNLRLVKDEDFYRCTNCNNEWFRDELLVIKYKTIRFTNDFGKEIYIPLTPEKLAEWKRDGKSFYSSGFKNQQKDTPKRNTSGRLSKKDKNLLRRLKK